MNGNNGLPGLSLALIGKDRNWIVVILLTIVTLGIYGLVYIYSVFEEAKRFGMVVHPAIPFTSGGAAIGFMFIPIFNFVWCIMIWFKLPGLLTKLNQARGRVSTGWAYLGFLNLIPIIGPIIGLAIFQSRMNEFWQQERQALGSAQ
jgi:hypothetical protein